MTFIFLIFTFKSRGSFLRAGAKAPTLWLSAGNRRVMCNAGICRHYILSCMYRFSFFRIPWWVCPHRSRHIFGESAVSTDPGNLVSVSSFLLSVFRMVNHLPVEHHLLRVRMRIQSVPASPHSSRCNPYHSP